MRKLWRLFLCALGVGHWNSKAYAWDLRPLFPIRCDHCGELFYFDAPRPTPRTDI